jgi:hypothetical protein
MLIGNKSMIKCIFIAQVGILCALVSGCQDRDVSSVEIVNISDKGLTDVFIKDSSGKKEIENIKSKYSVVFEGHLEGEGDANIYWREDGKGYFAHLCYYSKSFPTRSKIWIGGGRVKYRCRNEVS